MSPENTPTTPSPESNTEFITVPDWTKAAEVVAAPTVEAVSEAVVVQEAKAESARREIAVAFEDDIDSMKIQVKLPRAHSMDAIPGYQAPVVVERSNDLVAADTVDENARMRKITTIDAQGPAAPKKHWYSR